MRGRRFVAEVPSFGKGPSYSSLAGRISASRGSWSASGPRLFVCSYPHSRCPNRGQRKQLADEGATGSCHVYPCLGKGSTRTLLVAGEGGVCVARSLAGSQLAGVEAGAAAPGPLRADMNEVTLRPLLTTTFSIKTKTYRLAVLGAIEGILGKLRLLIAILALARLALAAALLAGGAAIPGPGLRPLPVLRLSIEELQFAAAIPVHHIS